MGTRFFLQILSFWLQALCLIDTSSNETWAKKPVDCLMQIASCKSLLANRFLPCDSWRLQSIVR